MAVDNSKQICQFLTGVCFIIIHCKGELQINKTLGQLLKRN